MDCPHLQDYTSLSPEMGRIKEKKMQCCGTCEFTRSLDFDFYNFQLTRIISNTNRMFNGP